MPAKLDQSVVCCPNCRRFCQYNRLKIYAPRGSKAYSPISSRTFSESELTEMEKSTLPPLPEMVLEFPQPPPHEERRFEPLSPGPLRIKSKKFF